LVVFLAQALDLIGNVFHFVRKQFFFFKGTLSNNKEERLVFTNIFIRFFYLKSCFVFIY